MTFPAGSNPGAIWMKCDFQVHTPRDRNWDGEKLAGGDEDAEKKRQTWANSFVDECLTRGLSAVAITDHHDFAFIPYVQAVIEDRNLSESLALFPGVEVTCNDSSQCIVLFDPRTDEMLWDQMFGVLPHIKKPDRNSQSGDLVELCGLNIADLLKNLCSSKVLEGKYIALPNGSGSGHHKTVLRRGFHERFSRLVCDGFYADHAISQYDPGDMSKIRGEIAEWGARRRGILPTGDNRSRNFERLGTNPCWIKLGDRTTEAIRQALLADEARVRYEAPVYATQLVIRLTVASTLTGDLTLTFNEGFNTIIGGRGSGKSALLEYLRFGIGRSALDPGTYQERERERQLLEETLASGSVTVELSRNGVREIWRRVGGSSTITVCVAGSPDETISVDEAQKRFRARAFSQKQLSTIIRSADDAAEQITGIAAVTSLDRRRDIEQEISDLKRAIQKCVSTMVDFWTAQGLHESASKSVNDLRRRIASTKEQLEAEGLSPEHRAVLEQAPKYDLADALLPEATTSLNLDLEQVVKLRATVPSVDTSRRDEVSEFPELRGFYQALDGARATIDASLATVEAELIRLKAGIETAAAAFATSSSEFRKQLAAASSGQAKLAALIAEQNRLAKELQEAESKERQQKALFDSLSNAPSELEQARERLAKANQRLRALLDAAANEVSTMSSGVLKAKVLEEGEPQEFIGALAALCEQAYVRDGLARCTDRVRDIMSAGFAARWSEVGRLAMDLLRERAQGPAGSLPQISADATDRLQRMLFSLTAQQATKIFEGIDSTKVGSLLSSLPKPFIEFEYKDGDRYIPFAKASQGQQAAALLDLLLRQQAGTLMIDQPEDDLDNRVIMDVANLLHSSKMARQLIFTTHNANFVVNGDADKVIALAPGATTGATEPDPGFRVRPEVDGAIDAPAVRKTITDTLEGGKDAFDLRARKYQFARS